MVVEVGKIVSVNPEKYTVKITTDGGKSIDDVQIAQLYDHPRGGGVLVVPEVGGRCLLQTDDDGNEAFVWGYLTPPRGDGFRIDKKPFPPGTIHLETADANSITLHRGGVLELVAAPLCGTLYLPILNTIRNFSENYETMFPGGFLGLQTNRVEPDPLGERTTFTLQLKERALDTEIAVEIFLGGTGRKTPPTAVAALEGYAQSDTLFEYRVGTNGSLFTYTIDKAGNEVSRSSGSRVLEVGGRVIGTISGGFALYSKASGTLEVMGDVTIRTTDSIFLQAASKIELEAPEVIATADRIRLGNAGASHPVILGDELLEKLLRHTHNGTASPSTPADFPIGLLSRKVYVEE